MRVHRAACAVLVLLVALVATVHATPACSTHKVHMYACVLVLGLTAAGCAAVLGVVCGAAERF